MFLLGVGMLSGGICLLIFPFVLMSNSVHIAGLFIKSNGMAIKEEAIYVLFAAAFILIFAGIALMVAGAIKKKNKDMLTTMQNMSSAGSTFCPKCRINIAGGQTVCPICKTRIR